METKSEVPGVVEEALPHELYRITCDDGSKVTASLGGVARQAIVRVIPGDRVLIQISSRDPGRGKITRRLS
ncbi:MAG: translation initiation factor IF-1 [Myxococcales bacterium]|nr:translation initiation factor IF-1 [Myxococcales bacterium]